MLSIIYAPTGTNGVQYVIDEANQTHQTSYIIAPEQYSFIMEKRVLNSLGISGLGGLEAISLSRLAHRLVDLPELQKLDSTGKIAVLTRILSKLPLEIYRYAKAKPSFALKLTEIISEFKRYGVTPEGITNTNKLPVLLEKKLSELAKIYEEYEKFINNSFLDTDDNMLRLAKEIRNCADLKQRNIYFVLYKDLTPVETAVAQLLLLTCKNLTVVCGISPAQMEVDIFESTAKMVRSFLVFAKQNNIEIAPYVSLEPKDEGEKFHLWDNFLCAAPRVYSQINNYIRLLSAETASDEVAEVARKIALHGEFDQTTIIACGETAQSMRDALVKIGVPCFVSAKLPLTAHFTTQFILAALECVWQDFTNTAIQQYIKCGFCNVKLTDELENYCLAANVNFGAWKNDTLWQKRQDAYKRRRPYAYSNEQYQQFNETRATVMQPLTMLKHDLTSGKTVLQKCESCFAFLRKVEFEQKLETICTSLSEHEQRRTLTAYTLVMQTFSQLTAALGECELGVDAFIETLRICFATQNVAAVPPLLNCVNITDIDNSIGVHAKYCYIVGATEGNFPLTKNGDSLLNERDREQLKVLGYKLAPNGLELAYDERIKIYQALLCATQQVTISYAEKGLQGEETLPSSVIKELSEMFPQTVTVEAQTLPVTPPLLSSDTVTLDVEIAQQLYGDNETYVTGLETFVKCPFMFFMRYGLKAAPREIAEFLPVDTGNILHYVADMFCQKVRTENVSWHSIDRAFIDKSVQTIMQQNQQTAFWQNTARNLRRMEKLEKLAARTLELITVHIQRGSFKPLGEEITFGERGQFPPLKTDGGVCIKGKIDRVDVYENYARVIDYKSGSKTFSLQDVRDGTDLQLAVYLAALRQAGYAPGGMLYFTLDDPLIEMPLDATESEITQKTLETLKMSGVINSEENNVKAMDLDEIFDFLPLEKDKTGQLKEKGLLSREELDNLLDGVKRRADEIMNAVKRGETSVSLLDTRRSPCAYCECRVVCGGGKVKKI